MQIRTGARRQSLIALVAGCFLASVPLAAPADAPQRNITYQLDIPPQSLGDGLQALALASNQKLFYQADIVAGRSNPPLKGEYTAEQAIRAILSNTDLEYEITADGVVFIRPKRAVKISAVSPAAESSSVTSLLTAVEETPSTADTRSPEIEEMVVTAQKRAQNIKDVPLSITAKSGEQLADARISNALDLSFAVPGLAVAETGPGRQIIVVRGLGSERGSSSLTGLYLDEMPVSGAQDGFNQSYIDLRTIDLERVEVLKGPQGTLFGEGSVGGTLRYITKDPELSRFGGSVNGSFYSTSDGGASTEVVGIANLPIATDVFGLRIAATYEDKAGWIDQPTVGREDINDNEVLNVRVKGLWTPSAAVTVKGMVIVHSNEGGGSNIVNTGRLEDSEFVQGQAFNGTSWDRSAPTDFTDEYELYNLNATFDVKFAELMSSTSYANINSVQSFTQVLGSLPTPFLEVLFKDYVQDAKILSQELRLTSTGEGPLNWTVGAFYKDAELAREWRSGYDLVSYAFSPTLFATGVTAGSKPTGTSESVAGYADAWYALTPRFRMGAGLRYFYDERESFDATNRAGTYQSGDFDATTFRVYGSFAATDDVNLYFNIGDGARSGGFNSPAYIVLGAPETFGPESMIAYEAGIKTYLFDRRVSFDAAVFLSEYKDMQDDIIATSPLDGTTQIQFTTTGQRAELKGVEWDLSWLATDKLTLSLAGDVIDTEITHAAPGAPFDVGDPINFVPEYSVVASTRYQFDWVGTVPGFFQLDFNRKGKSFQTIRRSAIIEPAQAEAPEVSFLNASVGLEHNDWQFTLFGRNLTDEDGIIRAGVTGQTAQARPRSVGVTIAKKF